MRFSFSNRSGIFGHAIFGGNANLLKEKMRPKGTCRGFTLVEMLVVLGIMGILSILVTIGFQSILGTAFTSEVSDLASTLTRARAYAMANNTYVYVGIQEVDGSQSASTTPQATGKGRLGVVVAASKDGTSGYTASSPAALPTTMIVVSPLRHFDGLHIMDPTSSSISTLRSKLSNTTSTGTTPATSNLYSATSLTTFQWPLSGTAQYSFGAAPGSVIQFNPQGEVQVTTGANTDSILQWIEIDLQPTHGNQVPSTTVNAAAILIDGASGSVTINRL